jgi:uncharacterized repeat protein (TIGR01451 family)
MKLRILALILPMTVAAPVQAQPRTAPEPFVPPIPSPFLFAKVMAPPGAKVTWYPGTNQAQSMVSGVCVGLRPGYSYRFELANVGEHKNETIYPSIEVVGTLITRPGMNVADHPVPITFTEEDLIRVLEGRLLTKVYFLEDPDKAVNGPLPPGVPLDISAGDEDEAIKEAKARGRLVLIVRAGERMWTREELAGANIPGTIYFEGAKTMPMPALPPRILHYGIPLFDPLIGPRQYEGECLHDGGDHKHRMGFDNQKRLQGIDPSDTVIEYSTPNGKKFAPSNKVCICIPRFAAMKSERTIDANHGFSGPQAHAQNLGDRYLVSRRPSIGIDQFMQPIATVGQMRASGILSPIFPITKDTWTGRPAAVAVWQGLQVTAQVREPEDLTVYPDCGLMLSKRMEPRNPQKIGDEVVFYLNYRNPTGQPMSEIVVTDSLTTRLEYINDTQKSDRPATFTASPNAAGSLNLRWQIDAPLLPGQSGTITFKARIK